jgi:hypothetical protein
VSGLFLDNITPEQVIEAITGIASDVSKFAPPPVGLVAGALAMAGPLVEKLLRARNAGVATDVLSKLLDDALVAASDVAVDKEFK